MYAPLLSSLPSDFPSLNTFPSSAKVAELKKPIKESKWFREQVGEYLTSNVYMYDPLLDLPHLPQEPLQDGGMIRMDVSTKTSPMKVNQRTDHLGNVNQRTESKFLKQTSLMNILGGTRKP